MLETPVAYEHSTFGQTTNRCSSNITENAMLFKPTGNDNIAHKTKQICNQDPEMLKFYEKYLDSKTGIRSKRKYQEIEKTEHRESKNHKRSKKVQPLQHLSMDYGREFSEFMKIENGEEESKSISCQYQDRCADDMEHVPVMPIEEEVDQDIYNLDSTENVCLAPVKDPRKDSESYQLEKEFKKKIRPLQKSLNSKQNSHLREVIIKYYGKIIGNIAWNLLLLLYQ